MTSFPKRLWMGLGMAVLGVGLALFVWLDVLEDRDRVLTLYRGPEGWPLYQIVFEPAFQARPSDPTHVPAVFSPNRGRVRLLWTKLLDPSDPQTPPLPDASASWVRDSGRYFLQNRWITSRGVHFPPGTQWDGWSGLGAGRTVRIWSFVQPTETATGLAWPASATWLRTDHVVFGPWFLVVVGGVWVFGMMWLVPGSRQAFWWWLGLPVRAVRGAWRRMMDPFHTSPPRGFEVVTPDRTAPTRPRQKHPCLKLRRIKRHDHLRQRLLPRFPAGVGRLGRMGGGVVAVGGLAGVAVDDQRRNHRQLGGLARLGQLHRRGVDPRVAQVQVAGRLGEPVQLADQLGVVHDGLAPIGLGQAHAQHLVDHRGKRRHGHEFRGRAGGRASPRGG